MSEIHQCTQSAQNSGFSRAILVSGIQSENEDILAKFGQVCPNFPQFFARILSVEKFLGAAAPPVSYAYGQ